MKMFKSLSVLKVASAAFFFVGTPAMAQWQTPNNSVAVGRGSPNVGFKSVGPCSNFLSVTWSGGVPACGSAIIVGTTVVSGGPGVLHNATSGGALSYVPPVLNGVLTYNGSGAPVAATTMPSTITYPSPVFTGTASGAGVTGTGKIALDTSAALTTPSLTNANVFGQLNFNGSTSGNAQILAQPVAGTPILALPNVSGTFAVGASAPLVLNTGTGNLTCPSCATFSGSALAPGITSSSLTSFGTSPTLVTPNLGTPSALTLTNATGLPIAGISGLGTGIATFLATPSSVNLLAAMTTKTGAGNLVFGTSPNITTPTGIVKGDVGLGNVDNTSDVTKWAATKTLTNTTYDTAGTGNAFSINGVAANANTGTGAIARASAPAFTNPTANTQTASDNSTKLATTAYVDNQVSAGVSGVPTFNGQSGAAKLLGPPQGRLTLTSGVAVMINSVAAANTLYYTPAGGRYVPIYNGTQFVMADIGAELSQLTTDATKSPSAVAASQVYDIFVWNDSGTIRATRGPAWSAGTSGSNTVRGTGAGSTSLTMLNGFQVNAVAITNGPAANQGTYVGTIMSDASSLLNMTFGSTSPGGTAALLGVWNAYNRSLMQAKVIDNNPVSWTYQTFAPRPLDNSVANRVVFVSGLAVDSISANNQISITLPAVASTFCGAGFSMDSTTVMDYLQGNGNSAAVSSFAFTNASGVYGPKLGIHYIQAMEIASTPGPCTFNPGGGTSLPQSFQVSFLM